ncbi:DUF2891 domain-containing protein [Nostoc ellipsosporum NOK]|nr:DUF2891 domain-containing protein [Nostoc ellipsosporum NOK]
MKKMAGLLLSVTAFVAAHAQPSSDFFTVDADSSVIKLTDKGASLLATLPLKCIEQEYPNKTSHTSGSDSDHVLTPRQLHPSFYGCFDWHSSVHGHWMLVRLLRLYPHLPETSQIREILEKSFEPQRLLKETDYFDSRYNQGWERTYGWAWLLKLDQELAEWDDAIARRWHAALQPLTQKIKEKWNAYLKVQTYPNRTGVHPNTAFGLAFALDYARSVNDTAFAAAIKRHAMRLYGNDKQAPARWEPDGSDFFSPSLMEADLMRRVLGAQQFIKWFNAFMPANGISHLTILPHVSDRTDYQIVHLDGLCLSRSWCMQGIARALPAGDPRKKMLQRSAVQHLATAIPEVAGGNYGGEHWLASFAIYALSAVQ